MGFMEMQAAQPTREDEIRSLGKVEVEVEWSKEPHVRWDTCNTFTIEINVRVDGVSDARMLDRVQFIRPDKYLEIDMSNLGEVVFQPYLTKVLERDPGLVVVDLGADDRQHYNMGDVQRYVHQVEMGALRSHTGFGVGVRSAPVFNTLVLV